MLRDGQWLPRPEALLVTVGAPLHPEGDNWAAAVRLRDAARACILADCREPDLPR